MKHFFAILLILSVLVAPDAFAQAKRIDKNLYGMNAEKDSFFDDLHYDPHKVMGWLEDLGVGHIRTGIPPFYGTNNQSWWDLCWENTADYCEEYGIKVTFLIGTGWWASGVDKQAYLTALGNKVDAYKGRIHYYELGNELDIPFQDDGITVAQYKEWLTDVAGVIRQKDPNARIIMASVAGRVHSGNGKAYGYLQEMLAAGCGGLVDYYSIHTYPHNPHSSPLGDGLKDLALLVSGMVQAAGAPRKPLLITEAGYPLAGPFKPPLADSGYQQRWNTQRLMRLWAKDVVEAYPVERIDTFVLQDYTVADGIYGFGLRDLNEAPRWQYNGLKTTYSLLDDAIFFRERNAGSDSKCYEYLKGNGRKVAVAWSSNWNSHNVNIPVASATAEVVNVHGSVTGSYSNVNSVSLSYTQEQKYLRTGNASHWKEGESPNAAMFIPVSGSPSAITPSPLSVAQCYGGKHLYLAAPGAGARRYSYVFNNLKAGVTYAVYVAATPPNVGWALPYQYALNPGTTYNSAPFVTPAPVVRTGVSYGTSNAIAWTSLGAEFTPTANGSWTFTLQVNTPSGDNRHFYVDAVYIEPK